jgi:hypothetical protein
MSYEAVREAFASGLVLVEYHGVFHRSLIQSLSISIVVGMSMVKGFYSQHFYGVVCHHHHAHATVWSTCMREPFKPYKVMGTELSSEYGRVQC